MTCQPTCKTPTPAQAHCSACHLTFGGVTGFDAHRRDGACRNPVDLGMVERDRVWRTPMADAARIRLAAIVPASNPDPVCCRCDPKTCAEDDLGDHCAERGCAWCLEGCPATEGVQCCRGGQW